MQIVIEIPDRLYDKRICDLDALREEVSSWGMNDYEPSDFTDAIDQADVIIEADKEENA